MKILFIVPIYLKSIDDVKSLYTLGGGGRYPFELAKNISDLGSSEVEMVFFGKSSASEMLGRMRISIIPAINIVPQINGTVNPLPVSMQFFRKIKKADVIHSIQIRTEATMLATLFARILRKPIFLTDNNFNGLSLSRIIKVESLATAVLTISKEDYESWNVKNKKIIYGGVDMKKFAYKKKKKPYVLYAGRITPHKGVDILVEAMPPEYKLIITGVVMEKDFLVYLKKIAHNKNVEFVENATDARLVELYQDASCFVLPATAVDYQGKQWSRPGLYALVVPEAMSCGTPVIVSNVGALPYFIENNLNGFTFKDRDVNDLRNKITKIISNTSLVESMGRRGRELVEKKYNWEIIAKNVERIYSAC